MSNVTKPIALDESINTTENTPRNIADVLAEELSNIADQIQGGGSGGSGGHIIQNASGANLTQRGTMQYKDAHAVDNSASEKTEVEVIKSVASADYSSETEDGLYLIPDGDGSVIEPASEDYVEVTADGEKTYGNLLNEIYTEMDATKIHNGSFLSILDANGTIFDIPLKTIRSNGTIFEFVSPVLEISNTLYISSYTLANNNSSYVSIALSANATRTPGTSDKPTSGTKLTLYYGNDKAVVDLQTTANRCLMSDGETVESALTPKYVTVNTNDVAVTLQDIGGYYALMDITNLPTGAFPYMVATNAYQFDGGVSFDLAYNSSTGAWRIRVSASKSCTLGNRDIFVFYR